MRSATCDDVGPRLALHVHHHRGAIVHPGGELGVLHAVHHLGHVGHAHGGPVLVGDDHVAVVGTGKQLVVGADGEGLARALEVALGLVHVGLPQHGAEVLEAEPVGSQCGGIGLDTHRRLLAAADRHEADTGELGDLLGEVGIGEVLDAGQRQAVRGDPQGEHGGVGGIDLAVGGGARQIPRQVGGGGVDGRLHLLLGDVDGVLQGELQDDERGALGARGGHLVEPGELTELSLQGCRDRGGHHLGAGAGVEGQDLDGGVIDLGQGRDGQLEVGHHAHEEHPDGEQGGRDGAEDEKAGRVHEICRL
jgi:hypothetical protein